MMLMVAVSLLVALGMRISLIKDDFEKDKQRSQVAIEETDKQFTEKIVVVKYATASPALPNGMEGMFRPLLPSVNVAKLKPATCHPITLHDLRRIPPRASPQQYPAHFSLTA